MQHALSLSLTLILACLACTGSSGTQTGVDSSRALPNLPQAGASVATVGTGTSSSGGSASAANTSVTTGGSFAPAASAGAANAGAGAASTGNAGSAGRASGAAGTGSANLGSTLTPDAGSPRTPGDAGDQTASMTLHGTGSCCAKHDAPGCGNADLQVCVCEKLPSCCTKAWDAACVFLVEQKYCQPGVRDCVCGTGSDQWGQAQCCDTEWSSSCDSVAEIKCGAVAGCF